MQTEIVKDIVGGFSISRGAKRRRWHINDENE
jgi:hypothetical protein